MKNVVVVIFLNRYCKVYLLPDKSKGSKRKTGVRKGTTDPVFGETLRVCFNLFFLYFSNN